MNILAFQAKRRYVGAQILGALPQTIPDAKEARLLNFCLYGNSVQTGTPLIESPVPITSVGELVTDSSDTHFGKYKIVVNNRGKNVLDKRLSSLEGIQNATAFQAWYSVAFDKNIIKNALLSNVAYTISYDMTLSYQPAGTVLSTAYGLQLNGSGGDFPSYYGSINQGVKIHIEQTFTPINLTNAYINCFSGAYRDSAGTTVFGEIIIENLQIEKGFAATSYEQYREAISTDIYLDQPLRKIGNHSDEFNRNGTIKRKIAESTQNVTDAAPRSAYLGTMTSGGAADENGNITVKNGETINYILIAPQTEICAPITITTSNGTNCYDCDTIVKPDINATHIKYRVQK